MPETINLESQVLADIARTYLKEQKRRRYWRIFFRSIFFLLIVLLLLSLFSKRNTGFDSTEKYAALIDIQGPIFDMGISNADNIAKSLRAAFEAKHVQGIVLRINSPGGSAVQADYIFNEIVRLREQYPDKPLYAVCTDICTSAAYYIAAAADQIYANPNSLVGSIGVIFNGFGFNETMHKLGIDRRLVTSGEYKAFMDPFSPLNKEEEQHLQSMLNDIHHEFQRKVRQGRGKRLVDTPELYSGLFWTGSEAQKLGLIDGYASPGQVAREHINTEKLLDYTVKPNYLERLVREFGFGMSSGVVNHLSPSILF